RRTEPVEALCVLEQRHVAARSHAVQDLGHARLDRGIGLGRPVAHALELGFELWRGGVEAADHAMAPSKASIKARSASRLSLSAAGLTTSRAEMSMIVSTSTKWLALSVLPVETRSTIASARPVSGASSIEP